MMSQSQSSCFDSAKDNDEWTMAADLFDDLLDGMAEPPEAVRPDSDECDIQLEVTTDSEDECLSNYLEIQKTVVQPRVVLHDILAKMKTRTKPVSQTSKLEEANMKKNKEAELKKLEEAELKIVEAAKLKEKVRRIEERKLEKNEEESFKTILQRRDEDSLMCMSRNAVLARENRIRKKMYLTNLEKELHEATAENSHFKSVLIEKEQHIKNMELEVSYLRSVIENQSSLSSLLKNIHTTAGLNFRTSEQNRKRTSVIENDENAPLMQDVNASKRMRLREKMNNQIATVPCPPESQCVSTGILTPCSSPELASSGGVCLHVSNQTVSLEFCPMCSTSAAEGWKVSGDHSYFKDLPSSKIDGSPTQVVIVEKE